MVFERVFQVALALMLFTACVGSAPGDERRPDAVLYFDRAVSQARVSTDGAIVAELLSNDSRHELLARLDISAQGAHWEDAEGNVQQLIVGGSEQEDALAVAALPTSVREAAIYLHQLWSNAEAEANVPYDDEGPVRCFTVMGACKQDGPSYCCSMHKTCIECPTKEMLPDQLELPVGCTKHAPQVTYDCSTSSDDHGDSDCGCSGYCGDQCCL